METCFGSIPNEHSGAYCCRAFCRKASIPVCKQSLACVVPLRVPRAGGACSNPLDSQADGWKKEDFGRYSEIELIYGVPILRYNRVSTYGRSLSSQQPQAAVNGFDFLIEEGGVRDGSLLRAPQGKGHEGDG